MSVQEGPVGLWEGEGEREIWAAGWGGGGCMECLYVCTVSCAKLHFLYIVKGPN